MSHQILPKLNCLSVAKRIPKFLRAEFKKRGKTVAIVGVSGGIDSGVVAALCEKAGLKLQKVFIPYGHGKISRDLKGCSFRIDITPIVDRQVKEIGKYASLDKIDKGNIMARTRMVIQYALARRLNGLVVGTENLSEYHLGYFTLHGDQACDINPISGFWKTQVMELARYLGLPIKKPSAGLWPGQTDEKELGFSYEAADPILYLYCVKKIAPEKIIKDFDLKAVLVYKVVERVQNTEYKRSEVPRYEQ